MISLQQYRSSIGKFRTPSHREAKIVGLERKVKRKAGNAVVLLLLYLILVAGGIRCLNQETKLKKEQESGTQYQYMKQIELYATVKYYQTSKSRNKIMHIQNGNRGEKGHPMTIGYWNKGSADLENRTESKAEIVQDYKPHVLGIGEAQFKQGSDLAKVQHPGYSLHLGPCLDTLGVCRVAVYTSNSLMVERRRDLEDAREPVVCLQLGLPHQKKILLLCGYRQWKVPGAGEESRGIQAQHQRWKNMLDIWDNAMKENKETIMMMVANLNSINWTHLDSLPAVHYDVQFKSLVEYLFEKIMSQHTCGEEKQQKHWIIITQLIQKSHPMLK